MRGASMAVLRRRLEAHGFGFHDFSYSSVTASLATNAAALAQFIERVPGDTVHLVGHSLGGVLACAMLETCMPKRIERIVCLGSPLKGSLVWPISSYRNFRKLRTDIFCSRQSKIVSRRLTIV